MSSPAASAASWRSTSMVVVAADQGIDRAAPEGLAEHAGGAQHPAGVELEGLEARLHHRQHRPGRGRLAGAALRLGADELLEEEGVAGRALADPLDDRAGDLGAERVAHQLGAGGAGQRRQRDAVEVAPGPQPREQLVDLRPGDREQEERAVAEAEGLLDEAQARQVGPVDVLDDEDDGPDQALGRHQRGPALADAIVHQTRALAGGSQGRTRLVRERHADHLAEELGAQLDPLGGDRASDPCAQRGAPHLRRIALAHPALPAQGLRHHTEGGGRRAADRRAPARPGWCRPGRARARA